MKPILMLLFFCSHLFSSDIVRFNIGGYKTEFTRQTVINFGGPVLNRLIDDSFEVNLDKEGYIFIDQAKRIGRLIAYFIHTQELPSDFDESVARKAAEYFQIDSLVKCIDINKQKLTKFEYGETRFYFSFSNHCFYCSQKEYWNDLSEWRDHLIKQHQAQIESIESGLYDLIMPQQHRKFCKIKYKIPLQ